MLAARADHRDIKPSNVLVTIADNTPVPKVIDFGVAKALSQQLTDKTVYTRVHAAVGTLVSVYFGCWAITVRFGVPAVERRIRDSDDDLL